MGKIDVKELKEKKFVVEVVTPEEFKTRNDVIRYTTQLGVTGQCLEQLEEPVPPPDTKTYSYWRSMTLSYKSAPENIRGDLAKAAVGDRNWYNTTMYRLNNPGQVQQASYSLSGDYEYFSIWSTDEDGNTQNWGLADGDASFADYIFNNTRTLVKKPDVTSHDIDIQKDFKVDYDVNCHFSPNPDGETAMLRLTPGWICIASNKHDWWLRRILSSDDGVIYKGIYEFQDDEVFVLALEDWTKIGYGGSKDGWRGAFIDYNSPKKLCLYNQDKNGWVVGGNLQVVGGKKAEVVFNLETFELTLKTI